MIVMKDCPNCGTQRIRTTVEMCGECEIAGRYEDQIEALENKLGWFAHIVDFVLGDACPDCAITDERYCVCCATYLLETKRMLSHAASGHKFHGNGLGHAEVRDALKGTRFEEK